MIFSEGGSHFEPEPNEEEGEEDKSGKEPKIIIRETYDGSEDPWDFLKRVMKKAEAKGYNLTIEEIIKQAEEQAEKRGDKFSFDSMEENLAKNIIFPGLVITLKETRVPEEAKEKEIIEEENDDDNDEEELEKKKGKAEEAPKEEKSLFETNIQKIRKALHSEDGRKLDGYLIGIKQKGGLLLSELSECTGTESDKAVRLRLLLFEDLETAEELGKILTKAIADRFDITLQRELVPILLIKSYLKRKYQDQEIPLPKTLLGVEIIEETKSMTEVVDDRPR